MDPETRIPTMPVHEDRLPRWGQLREWLRIIVRDEQIREGSLTLLYPPGTWYAEHAGEMLRLLVDTTGQLERSLGLTLPTTDCFVSDPETAMRIQGTTGMAYGHSTLIGFPERCMSEFAATAAHELAHILSYRLGRPEPRFLAEGFASYAAERIGVDVMPLGVPPHYHTAWLLSAGVTLRLTDLWARRDYTPELYDLAWSFADFLVERFGQERYFQFYAAREPEIGQRIEQTLGMDAEQVMREWHEFSRRQHRIIRGKQRQRYPGSICSRAAWLRQRGLTNAPAGPAGDEAVPHVHAAEAGRTRSTSPSLALPLLLPVLEADKYDQRPAAGTSRWRPGHALRKLPPVLTPGGPRARIVAEVYPDESPENASRRQRAGGQETPLDRRDKDKPAGAAVREALERAVDRQDGRVPRAPGQG
jgi:hypothetical protein